MSCNCGCNGNLQILTGEKGDPGADGGFTGLADIVLADSTALALTVADSGSTVVFSRAGGVAVTLPSANDAATVGVFYDFVVFTSVTNPNAYTITAETGVGYQDLFAGAVVSVVDAASPLVFAPNGTTNDVITMSGTTSGGIAGTELTITCVAINTWMVTGTNICSPAPAVTIFGN